MRRGLADWHLKRVWSDRGRRTLACGGGTSHSTLSHCSVHLCGCHPVGTKGRHVRRCSQPGGHRTHSEQAGLPWSDSSSPSPWRLSAHDDAESGRLECDSGTLERRDIREIQSVELPLNRKQLDALLLESGLEVVGCGSVVNRCGRLALKHLLNSDKLNALLS